jgi:hypothetical protein
MILVENASGFSFVCLEPHLAMSSAKMRVLDEVVFMAGMIYHRSRR